MHFLYEILGAAWTLLVQSSLYILFGLAVGGLLKMFLSADYVAAHLGKGKIKSVFKAALLGVPIPLCSCGVLPAAAQLKKQGANNGATTAFLISTPESGVDSIAISWALLDPLMTVARPVGAFLSAFVAGVLENVLFWREGKMEMSPSLAMASVPMAACADGACSCGREQQTVGLWAKLKQGVRYAVTDIWGDLAGWFFVGIAIAALILKGVSPGAALVFLLAGPATNITALAVLVKILGKRGVAVYLAAISVVSVLCGLALDGLYFSLGISALATIGEVAETLPHWLMLTATGLLLVLSVPVLIHRFAPAGPIHS